MIVQTINFRLLNQIKNRLVQNFEKSKNELSIHDHTFQFERTEKSCSPRVGAQFLLTNVTLVTGTQNPVPVFQW